MVFPEGVSAKADIELIIESFNINAEIYRPTMSTSDFHGRTETSETKIDDMWIEMKPLDPQSLEELKHDMQASIFADSDVLEGDKLVVSSVDYRVVDVKIQNFFGTVTHKDLKLEIIKDNYA